MSSLSASLVAMVLLASPWAQAAVTCPGGYQNGAIVRSDPYWHECVNGRLEPRGCLTNTGRQIRIGESFTTDNDYIQECMREGNGLKLKPMYCLIDGVKVQAGQEHTSRDYWFECAHMGHYLEGKVKGCLMNGQRIAIGQKLTRDGTSFECQPHSDRSAKLTAIGCSKDNREYPIGQMFEDEKFFYHCSYQSATNTCRGKIIGCVQNGKRFFDRQVLHKGDEIYRCMIDTFRDEGNHELIGCLKRDPYSNDMVEKTFGCQWEDGQAPHIYLVECVERNGKAFKQRLRCKYSGPEGQMDLLIGCYGTLGSRAVGCARTDDGNLEIKTFGADQEHIAIQYGLVSDPYACDIFTRRS